jgi:hypothetical protein
MTLLSSQNPSATGRTIENDRFTIDLSRVFCIIENKTNSEVEEQSFEYVFRGMVCYYGRHYVGFFASRSIEQDGKEMERWFLFDDTRVKRVGTWEEVRSRIERGGYQPTLLFYEKKDLARKKLEQLATDIHTWWKETAEDKQNKPSSSTTTTKETVIEMNHPTISPSKNNCTLANSPSKLISSSEDDVVVPPPTSSVRRSQMYGDDNILNMHEQSVRDMISRLDGLISNKSGLDTRISLGNSIALGSSMSIGSTGSMMLGSTNAPPGSFRRVSRSRRRESLRLQPPSSNTGTIQEVDVNPDDIFGDDSEASIQVVKLSKPQLSSPRQPMTGKKEPTKEKNVVISIKTFEVELNAADGGIGLVLEDGNNEMIRSFIRGRTSRDGRGSAFVVVKGFETNGAGQKLPAQASGQIQLGDLLIRVNENELTSNAYEALELIFMSENPVRLVFQRILPWECPKCTLLNEFTTSTCGVCTFQVDLPYQLSNTT